MQQILIRHAQRYSDWEINDLYKLIHQVAMGSEHALVSFSAAREWLQDELEQLFLGPLEPLIESISPDGRIVRVHLRPFVQLHLQGETLLRAFFRTASEFPGSPEKFAEYASVAAQLSAEGILTFRGEVVQTYLADMIRRGLPAVHHSAKYREFYRPAYRVVIKEFLPVEILEAAGRFSSPG